MGLLNHFRDFLDANRGQASKPSPSPSTNPAPPSTPGASPTGTGHIERKRLSFVEVGPNDTIPASDEEWLRNGNVMEGVHHEVRVITGSGDIAEPARLKTICSQCRKAESEEIRSSISNAALCRTCMRRLTMPDGTVKILTPDEYVKELDRYDTWKARDNNQELPRR